MPATETGFVVPEGTGRGPVLTVSGRATTLRATAAEIGGEMLVFDEGSPPGTRVSPHRHAAEDGLVPVRVGAFEAFLNGAVTQVGAGAVPNFARGSLHGFRCVGTEPGQTTWIVTPGTSTEAFLYTLAALPLGPPDMARLDALHARHGIAMAPPPEPWWFSP